MTRSRVLLVPLVLAFLAPPAPAGLFSRKTKPDPATRVPELVIQLKSSTDEAQRTAAAEELRQYDAKAFPDITAALTDALVRDTSPGVRAEAASSLGKLRPISQQAGYALEQAQANDASMRVRLAARQALWQYHLVGYRNGKPPEPPAAGKPDATVAAPPGPSTPAQPRSQAPRYPGLGRETIEPPLAPPAGTAPATPVSRPSASIPARNPLAAPATPPRLQPATQTPATPPPALPAADGPALPPG